MIHEISRHLQPERRRNTDMEMPKAPADYNYDCPEFFFFEVYPDGRVNHVPYSRSAIMNKDDESVYGAYFRAVAKKCDLYFSSIVGEGYTAVQKIEDLEGFADSLGIMRPTAHVHEIRASYSENDSGSGRYAEIDLEFRCGCTLSNRNKRIIVEQLKAKYGWNVVLNSIDSIPMSRRTIRVERNSIRNMPK